MTDNEIKKALEYCCGDTTNGDDECREDMCYQVGLPEDRNGDTRWCRQWLLKDALDLLKSQKAEIERLKAENTDLKKAIETMTNEHIKWGFEAKKRIENAKSEAIKEVAEKLPELIPNINGETTMKAVERAMQHILKEMVGDDHERRYNILCR